LKYTKNNFGLIKAAQDGWAEVSQAVQLAGRKEEILDAKDDQRVVILVTTTANDPVSKRMQSTPRFPNYWLSPEL
jgi:hypothetical protein